VRHFRVRRQGISQPHYPESLHCLGVDGEWRGERDENRGDGGEAYPSPPISQGLGLWVDPIARDGLSRLFARLQDVAAPQRAPMNRWAGATDNCPPTVLPAAPTGTNRVNLRRHLHY
jgi:hypothetical protein